MKIIKFTTYKNGDTKNHVLSTLIIELFEIGNKLSLIGSAPSVTGHATFQNTRSVSTGGRNAVIPLRNCGSRGPPPPPPPAAGG